MKNATFVLFAMILIICMGCSGITAIPIHTKEDDLKASGFRYYENSPYILVYPDGKSLKSELIYLPDRTRKMSVELFDFISSNNAKLNFTDGVLTNAENESDATIVPKAFIEAAKQAAVAMAKGAAFNAIEEDQFLSVPPPSLYKLIIDGDYTRLIGAKGAIRIKVNVAKGGQS
jgi:hypothetical protein